LAFEYVNFPKLGLQVPVARTLFKVFGQDIYTYAVIISLSIVLMIVLGLRHAERYDMKQDAIIDFMIFALPASIICGRLYYVIFSWDNYKNNPIDILNIRQGGLAIYGAVIGAFLTLLIFSKVRKIDALRFFDFGVPYLILAQGIGRWGNFVNQEVFGTNTALPWGMTSDRISAYLYSSNQWLSSYGITVDPLQPVHPTFLYESLWNILVAIFLFRLRKRNRYKGEVLLGYLIGYGAGRAFIEGLRTDSLMLGNFRVSQLISIIAVIVCSLIIILFRSKFSRYDIAAAETAGATAGGEGEIGAGDAEAVTEDADAAEPEAAIADATGPETVDADAAEPDAIAVEATEPDAIAVDASEPDAAAADASEPDAVNIVDSGDATVDASEPDAAAADASEPDAFNDEVFVAEKRKRDEGQQ